MRRIIPFGLALAILLGAGGCNLLPKLPQLPFLGGAKEPSAKKALGLEDERITELDSAGLDSEMSKPKHGLRLTMRADKASYQVGEAVVVDLRIENITTSQETARDIPVYFEPVARTRESGAIEWLFKFHINSEPDQRLVYRSPDIKVPEADRADYYHYVVLPPQSFVGRRFIFWPARARGLMTPGRYTIRAAYQVSEDSAYVIINRHLSAQQVELLGTKLAYVRVWTGQVFSNPVTFVVERKKLLGIF